MWPLTSPCCHCQVIPFSICPFQIKQKPSKHHQQPQRWGQNVNMAITLSSRPGWRPWLQMIGASCDWWNLHRGICVSHIRVAQGQILAAFITCPRSPVSVKTNRAEKGRCGRQSHQFLFSGGRQVDPGRITELQQIWTESHLSEPNIHCQNQHHCSIWPHCKQRAGHQWQEPVKSQRKLAATNWRRAETAMRLYKATVSFQFETYPEKQKNW